MAATRHIGRLVDWNDAKGFGFVEPQDGGERAFVHIKSIMKAERRPSGGELISYEVEADVRGRRNAVNIRHASNAHSGKVRRTAGGTSLRSWWALLILAALAMAWWTGRLPNALTGVYASMSVLTLALYWRDKRAAMAGDWRTPEVTLHVSALLGGWPGALLAQGLLRHKSNKASFQFAFCATVLGNCAVTAWAMSTGALS